MLMVLKCSNNYFNNCDLSSGQIIKIIKRHLEENDNKILLETSNPPASNIRDEIKKFLIVNPKGESILFDVEDCSIIKELLTLLPDTYTCPEILKIKDGSKYGYYALKNPLFGNFEDLKLLSQEDKNKIEKLLNGNASRLYLELK